jgi:hypothetical protein
MIIKPNFLIHKKQTEVNGMVTTVIKSFVASSQSKEDAYDIIERNIEFAKRDAITLNSYKRCRIRKIRYVITDMEELEHTKTTLKEMEEKNEKSKD